MLKTANNVAIVQGINGVARAHILMPDFNDEQAFQIAERIELLVAEEKRMHVVAALCFLLLKGLGALPSQAMPGFLRRQ